MAEEIPRKENVQMKRLAWFFVVLLIFVCSIIGSTIDAALAQQWRWMPSGYHAWGAYREWPRGWQGFNPGYRYYGPGTYQSFSPWQRNPYYRY